MSREPRLLGGALLALALLVGASGLAYRAAHDLIATRRTMAHTRDVLDTVTALVDLVKDGEIAIRDYVVTADDRLVRRRDVLRPEIAHRLRHLRRLVADDPDQTRSVDAFDAGIRAQLAYSDDVAHQRATRDLGPDEIAGRLAEGRRRTDELVGRAALVGTTERERAAAREVGSRARTERALTGLLAATVLGAGLLLAVFFFLQREIAERRRVTAELQTSERRLTLALDASRMGLWDLDLATDRSYRTLRHDQIFGFDGLQPTWSRAQFLQLLHPDDRETERAAFERALATGEFRMEVRIVRNGDGAIRWIACEGKTFHDDAGIATRLMGSVTDVTERKEAEERLRERTEQLETANDALRSFTSSVSHDLRAPLRAIDGYAHILAEEHADAFSDETRRVLDVIRTNARQMGRLIDDLLSFSRVGRVELERTHTDLGAVAGAIVDELRRLEPERDVTVVVGALPPASVDPRMVRQLMANLVGNAWKFTRGRPHATIEIGSERDGDETIYRVRDDGAGFDMRHAAKIFRVFERLHAGTEFEGTGVGLAIVQRIVQRHGGRVWATGSVGRGATFYFTLPPARGERAGTRERGDVAGGARPA